MIKWRLLIFLSLLCFSISAQNNFKVRIDSLIHHIESYNKAFGSVAILQDGELVYQNSMGYADYEQKIKADATSLYRIGSITKTYASTIIMQLIEENKLGLDSKLSEFFPKLPKAKKITIEDMLRHQSGLANLTAVSDYMNWMEKDFSKQEIIDKIHQLKSDFRPGSKTEYSNTNYILLGLIAEMIDKKPFEKILIARICSVCDLENTYIAKEPKKSEAKSYVLYEDWKEERITSMSIPRAAGAIVSSPYEVSKFYDCLFRGKLLSASNLQKMMTLKDHMGLGMFVIPFGNRTGYGHTGGIDGFRSMAIYFPLDKMSISYLSNGVDYPLNDIMIGILSQYYNTEYDFPNFEKVQYDLTAITSSMICGNYNSKDLPIDITVFEEDGKLYGQGSGQAAFPMTAIGPLTYKYEKSGIKMEFYPKEKKMILKQAGGEFVYYLK